MKTLEEKRISARTAEKKYKASEKGKATRRAYENTPEVRMKKREYQRGEKFRQYTKEWEKQTPGRKKTSKARRKIQVRYKQRYDSEPCFRILQSCRVRIRQVLEFKRISKLQKTVELIGCNPEFLKKWLEFWMKPGMTWENYGEWHIDHKKPCSSFDLTKLEEQKICFNYQNLEPLWAVDNCKKGDKICPASVKKL